MTTTGPGKPPATSEKPAPAEPATATTAPAKPAASAVARKLMVTLLRSHANRPEKQKATLRGLGLKRPHKSVVLNDTPAIRGMIFKVQHLVRVDRAE